MLKNITRVIGTAVPIKPIWPENLYCAIFKLSEYKDIPFDVEESIQHILEQLTHRERGIVTERFKNECSFKEVAEMFDVTGERIRQIEAKVLRKLRHPERAKYLINGLAVQAKEDAKEHMSRLLKMQERIKAADALITDLACRIEESTNLAEIGIEKLNLSVRAYNCLHRAGVYNLELLCTYSLDDLLKIRNLGRRTLDEIVSVCDKLGMSFKEDENNHVGSAVQA